MARVALRGIRKHYGDTPVIQGVDLDIPDGEFVVFVGPSGCGKSTLLRMIAGLEPITAGTLELDGVPSNDIDPARRGIAMVFQSYALYPHMTVAENMGFALRLAKVAASEIAERVGRAADALQIAHLLDRKPADLSGGQRQRVAIGRAIVRRPSVFLFDEPLSNLDAALRGQTRVELARLHKELATTMIYVTHDQVEAMTLGQKIVVFNAGRIEQSGTPYDLYERPANRFVAGFLGSPRMNFLPGVFAGLEGGLVRVVLNGGVVTVAANASRLVRDGAVTLGVRPEHLHVLPGAASAAGGGILGKLALVEYLGDVLLAHVQVDGVDSLVAVRCAPDGTLPPPGGAVRLGFDPERAHLFDADGVALGGQPAAQNRTGAAAGANTNA